MSGQQPDLDDLSEVSVQLESSEHRESYDDEEYSGSEEEEEEFLDAKGRTSVLKKLITRMATSDLFDEDDEAAVRLEIERIVENERNSLQTQMKERLRILTKFDHLLDMGTHHPKLNEYFVRKQQEMTSLT